MNAVLLPLAITIWENPYGKLGKSVKYSFNVALLLTVLFFTSCEQSTEQSRVSDPQTKQNAASPIIDMHMHADLELIVFRLELRSGAFLNRARRHSPTAP